MAADDKKVNLRGGFYDILEAAASKRYLSVAAFVTAVMGEHLRQLGELDFKPAPPAPAPVEVKPKPKPKAVQEYPEPYAYQPVTERVPMAVKPKPEPQQEPNPQLAAVLEAWGPEEGDD